MAELTNNDKVQANRDKYSHINIFGMGFLGTVTRKELISRIASVHASRVRRDITKPIHYNLIDYNVKSRSLLAKLDDICKNSDDSHSIATELQNSIDSFQFTPDWESYYNEFSAELVDENSIGSFICVDPPSAVDFEKTDFYKLLALINKHAQVNVVSGQLHDIIIRTYVNPDQYTKILQDFDNLNIYLWPYTTLGSRYGSIKSLSTNNLVIGLPVVNQRYYDKGLISGNGVYSLSATYFDESAMQIIGNLDSYKGRLAQIPSDYSLIIYLTSLMMKTMVVTKHVNTHEARYAVTRALPLIHAQTTATVTRYIQYMTLSTMTDIDVGCSADTPLNLKQFNEYLNELLAAPVYFTNTVVDKTVHISSIFELLKSFQLSANDLFMKDVHAISDWLKATGNPNPILEAALATDMWQQLSK